jgi:hypothetical protein
MERPCKHAAARAALFALAIVGLAGPGARAGLLPSTPSITAEGDKFRWTYSVFAPSGVEIHLGDAFVLYDVPFLEFPGGMPGQPPGWTLPGLPPGSNFPLVPGDDPELPNMMWGYVGDSPITPGPTGATLGSFSLLAWSDVGRPGMAGSRFHQSSDGRVVWDTTAAIVPVFTGPPPPAPEPATLVLLGAALPLLGAASLLRRHKAPPGP